MQEKPLWIDQLPNGGIWIPAKVTSNWLLVALHGSEGSSKDFSGLEDIFDISELNYLYLNGPIRSYSGFRWYSGLESRQTAYDAIGFALDQSFAAGYPRSHTFLLGFSQGAALTIEFGARYPPLLAGYIGISGRIENLPGLLAKGIKKNMTKGKWLMTHGTRDFNLSIAIIREQVKHLAKAGFSLEFREYDKIHEFDKEAELPEIREWILHLMH